MAVIIGGITPRDNVTDNATLFLDNPWGVHALKVGDRAFVYGQGEGDDGISAFELGSDGQLTSIQNVADDAILELDAADNFASAVVGGTTYLFVNGYADSGISAFRVAANGTLTNVDNVTDDGTLNLSSTEGRMATATVGGATFLIASSTSDDGVSVFRIEADGQLTNTDNETDAGLLELDGAEDVATATVNGRTFVFAAGYNDDGLSVFELSGGGTLTSVSNATDSGTLELDGAWGVATAAVGGATYLVASGNTDDGLSVFSVSDTGQLTNVFNVSDDATRGLDGAAGLTTFTLDTETFVAVSSDTDDALGIFHLGAGGVLTDVTTVFDSLELELDGSLSQAFVTVGGAPILVGNGRADDGLSTFDLGSGNDTLTGTAGADVLLGLAGNDTLNGAGGEDRLIGGSGDDTYLVDSVGDAVAEQTDGGTDTVQASISTTLGANVESLALTGAAALDGTGNALDNQITGNGGSNDLNGGKGDDRLEGRGKADTLLGGKGRDVMEGGGGADDFVYTKVNQSGTTNATRDQILDFKSQDDLVFTQIDAIKGQPGNQNFTFDLNGSFSAGEIRFREVAKGVLVELNVDGDQAAELSILLKGFTGTLANNDFEV